MLQIIDYPDNLNSANTIISQKVYSHDMISYIKGKVFPNIQNRKRR